MDILKLDGDGFFGGTAVYGSQTQSPKLYLIALFIEAKQTLQGKKCQIIT